MSNDISAFRQNMTKTKKKTNLQTKIQFLQVRMKIENMTIYMTRLAFLNFLVCHLIIRRKFYSTYVYVGFILALLPTKKIVKKNPLN